MKVVNKKQELQGLTKLWWHDKGDVMILQGNS